ncbi:hypothetical protein [Fibrobacter sp. UWB11]|uniref:hypothetical protein n=1 Tax=Fibrobacter sp. UWB11 TaxID=1896202 RepID=UPI000928F601|nr:hypothetical protein [Fibrobacter sp. UWB11]SIO28007.1 hypothetical protein SAMN05720758_1945 [Fibrobacter sp. UWB11]
MRNKILVLIAFSLFFFTLACTDDSLGGGSSIDPNANPAVYANNSSSSNGGPGMKGFDSDGIVFKSEITQTLEIAKGGEEWKGGKPFGKIDVYAEENGASAVCENETVAYSAKFKVEGSNLVKRNVRVKINGSVCDSMFEDFRSSCSIKNGNDELGVSCDENGLLLADCVYSDETADFDTLLSVFIAESKKTCAGELVK